jgi:hypothetical protein
MQPAANNDVLVDIRDVQVDKNLTQRERVSEYNRQIKDPCHYKCNKLTVTAKFADNGVSLEDCLRSIES